MTERTITTRRLKVPGATLTYDIHSSTEPSTLPPLFAFGSPMGASGFGQLVSQFTDRTVVTYDPRAAERSVLHDGGEVTTEIHGDDLHRIVQASGLGPVDAFGTSGGAAVALAWAAAQPEDVRTLVAHEPPLFAMLEDAAVLEKINAGIGSAYQSEGYGPAMARFVQLVMHRGPLTADDVNQPSPDPTMFGFPTEDDGSRDDALLAYNLAMPPFIPDAEALTASGVRIVPAVGADTEGTIAHRGGQALGTLLGIAPVTFPGDHTGFGTNDWTPNNDPIAFAKKLREALAAS